MPGRLLGIFNRTSKTDSAKSSNYQSDGCSDSGKGPKKVSFDTKVKFKKFKLGRKQKPGERLNHQRSNREDNHVVAYLFPGPFKGSYNKKNHGVATSSATNEFWFNRPTATSEDATGSEPTNRGEIKADAPEFFLKDNRCLSCRMQQSSSSNFNYDLDPSLHPSQKPSEVPRVKRNLVRNIVAQFNEEARKRDSYTSNENLSEFRTTSPNLIEATPENAPNQNRPFSYMAGSSGSAPSSGSTTLGPRSKSEYNITQSPSDLIYAKVVVNGKNGSSGKSEGRYKTTVHTKVPNRSATKFSSNTLGNSARADGRSVPLFDDSKKYFSKSTSNLLSSDGDAGTDHQTALKSKQNGKKTDNSYYKFDAVDDEFVRQAQGHGGSLSNGKSKGVSRANGHHHHRDMSSSSSSFSRQQQQQQKSRRNSSGIESDEDDRRYPLLSHQSHPVSKSPGSYETRNVEKWSENEVGPNSRKYTEHEYIHEVSMSGDDQRDGDRVKHQQDKSFWNSMERKVSKWTSDVDLSGSASSLSKKSSKQRSKGSREDILRMDDHRDDVFKNGLGNRHRSPTRLLLRSRSGGDNDGGTIEREVTTSSRPLLSSSPGYRKSTTMKEDTKAFTKTLPSSSKSSPSSGLTQYYFGEREAPNVEVQEDTRYTAEHLQDSWRNHHHVNDFRKKNQFQRRGSSDSGSGVGLLSSKLVKKANAEVNGGGGSSHSGRRNGFTHGSVEQLSDSRENVRSRRRRSETDEQQQRTYTHDFSFDNNADKLASSPPSPWSVNRTRHSDNDVVDHAISKYENDTIRQATASPSPLGGYTTEERKVIRKEETKRTTRREVRTTTPVSVGDDIDDQDEEKLFLEHHRQIQNDDKYDEDGDTRRQSSERQSTLERKQREKQQQQRRHHHESRSKLYDQDSHWNDKKFQEEKSDRLLNHKSTDRKLNVEPEDRHSTATTATATSARRHRHTHNVRSERAFSDEFEDKMETSGSEPHLYGGSQDSRMSLGSHVSSADEEEEVRRLSHRGATTEDIIAAHVNTPQSMVKQMNKQQISYENSQQSSRDRQETTGTSGRRFWFERTADEEDDIRRAHTRQDKQDVNRNHYHNHYNKNYNNNNNTWTSATMSRLESSKNRRNYQDEELVNKVNTVDRRDRRHHRQGDDIRIQLNDRDVVRNGGSSVPDGKRGVDRSPSFNSRVGSYHSENESQHSAGSSSSAKKRVNFKSRHGGGGKNGHSGGNFGSRSDLSPMHREALLRSASPARAPSTSGSLKSNESEASQGSSNKSVILHATAVADIPPAREYQYRSATISPTPPPSVNGSNVPGVNRETRTVQRSFSLLSPWKPRRYKNKYEKRGVHKSTEHLENGHHHHHHHHHQEDDHHDDHRDREEGRVSFEEERAAGQQRIPTSNHQTRREAASSRGSSSEKLDSLPPLPSEEPPVSSKGKNKKKSSSGLLRRHSMPKDSRFANFFRRRKEAKK